MVLLVGCINAAGYIRFSGKAKTKIKRNGTTNINFHILYHFQQKHVGLKIKGKFVP